MIRTCLGALALAGIFAACAPDPAPDKGAALPLGPAGIVSIFADVCIASAPDFVAAQPRMKRAGLTDAQATGTHFHPSGSISAKVQTRTEPTGISVNRCSVVFKTSDNDITLAALTQRMAEDPITQGPPKPAAIGARGVQVWKVLIEGRPGRVIFAPQGSARLLGGIYLDIPNDRASA